MPIQPRPRQPRAVDESGPRPLRRLQNVRRGCPTVKDGAGFLSSTDFHLFHKLHPGRTTSFPSSRAQIQVHGGHTASVWTLDKACTKLLLLCPPRYVHVILRDWSSHIWSPLRTCVVNVIRTRLTPALTLTFLCSHRLRPCPLGALRSLSSAQAGLPAGPPALPQAPPAPATGLLSGGDGPTKGARTQRGVPASCGRPLQAGLENTHHPGCSLPTQPSHPETQSHPRTPAGSCAAKLSPVPARNCPESPSTQALAPVHGKATTLL